MTAARKKQEEIASPLASRPPQNPETRQREKLLKELGRRTIELAQLKDGWGDRGSKAPQKVLLGRAYDLGIAIAYVTNPMPRSINLGVSGDGHLLFSVFGFKGREIDLWIEDDSGDFIYSGTDGSRECEGRMPIAAFFRMAEWIAGRSLEP